MTAAAAPASMLGLLRSLLAKSPSKPAQDSLPADAPPPLEIVAEGLAPFPLAPHMARQDGLPILDWKAVDAWLAGALPRERQAVARAACQDAWLLHFRQALGPAYHLAGSATAVLLSPLEPNVSRAALEYMERTARRIARVLDGIARGPAAGRHIFIVLEDAAACYRYAAAFPPAAGDDIAYGGAALIDGGCSHYVTVRAGLGALEPAIAHAMIHGCLAHLELPLWLNEGLAVNTGRLVGGRSCGGCRPRHLAGHHPAFWGEAEIREFWSGAAFHRPDEGHLLAYDLARLLVERLARDWESFRRFVLAADRRDAGAEAAERHLGIELGGELAALLETPAAG